MFDIVSLIKSASLLRIVEVRRLDHRVSRGVDPSDAWDWDEVHGICLSFAFRFAKNLAQTGHAAQ
jgi:hypothetical protein